MEKETKNQINKIELELVNRELARRKFIDYCRYVLH
jgi:hypothetical protein